ncbi:MAG: YcbK family protein [Syntrophotalea acetylenica]|jgi:uncharacterized protein YcbK (DUF882 family)|uniref:Murein endopeptidase K n=1 Tax=Syntrophotalea acetylenica TaxID=29542 RepID=A0A1L3GG34_SYNAC|nr:YcbK family protein [Syntrophotalea acetylenica]APG24906.1 Twin-arginine translocation pathway signal [Syntrophotalea acetylenica]APG42970.1 Twin-arginine translocation pathway signal [Syntrophotalea acetylenica]MDD4456785.1 YcbK family protein [Syntrophotalea acetylenica]MDY0261266.1 YcbK family protein [Syntrophotalea acetylenica]
MNRRQFLKTSLAVTGSMLLPWPALASLAGTPRRSLSLYNTHTGEHLRKIVYWENGAYLPEQLQQINHLLRDHRTGEVKTIDPRLFDILNGLQSKTAGDAPFEIISGYRSPATNHKLQSHSRGVAKNSLHMVGQAIDIRLPGYPLGKLRKAAISMKQGGVGYYPQSNFIHLDTGRVRCW